MVEPGAILAAIDRPALLIEEGRIRAANESFVRAHAPGVAAPGDLAGLRVEEAADLLDPPAARALRTWRQDLPDSPFARRPLDVEPRAVLLLGADRSPQQAAAPTRRSSLEHRERLAVLGALAEVCAHDLNNQLSAVVNASALLEAAGGDEAKRRSILDLLESAATHAIAVARRMQRLVSDAPIELTAVPLGPLLDETRRLLRHELSGRVRLELAVDDAVGHVRADEARLVGLLARLLLEAAWALPGAGEVAVSVRPVHLDDRRRVGDVEIEAGSYAVVECAAPSLPAGSGGGVSLEGLPGAAHEVVERAGVRLHRLFLPLAEEGEDIEPEGGATCVRNTERGPALVHDPDPHVAHVLAGMLRHLGFDPVRVLGPDEMLVALEEKAVRVVVLGCGALDGQMEERVRRIRERAPEARIVVAASLDGDERRAREAGADALLRKPFGVKEVRRIVADDEG